MIRRTSMITAGIAGALLLLSACGGTSSASSTTGAPAAAASAAASPEVSGAAGAPDMAAYRKCLSDNGVTLPEFTGRPSGAPSGMPSGMPSGAAPSGGFGGGAGGGAFGGLPDGVDQETFDAAQAACASLAPQGGFGQRGPGGGAQIDATALAAYRSCLTDHDVTIPEGDNWMRSLDGSDPTVQSAMDTCAPLLPVPVASSTASPSAAS